LSRDAGYVKKKIDHDNDEEEEKESVKAQIRRCEQEF